MLPHRCTQFAASQRQTAHKRLDFCDIVLTRGRSLPQVRRWKSKYDAMRRELKPLQPPKIKWDAEAVLMPDDEPIDEKAAAKKEKQRKEMEAARQKKQMEEDEKNARCVGLLCRRCDGLIHCHFAATAACLCVAGLLLLHWQHHTRIVLERQKTRIYCSVRSLQLDARTHSHSSLRPTRTAPRARCVALLQLAG
jgi:hypothetical protein